jgi:hypothetical protein
LQLGGVPAWQPLKALHVSAPSQNSPLSHKLLVGVYLQLSLVSSHESTVQETLSPHTLALPPLQVPAWQVSPSLQNNPSLQALPSFAGCAWHASAASLHTPRLHWLPKAEQFGAVPALQV